MGTLDGPGIRFVVFSQGCNLRCGCCHNPDTWDITSGEVTTAQELVSKAIRYKTYFGTDGGVTVSGGEPLLQAEFVSEFFKLCHLNGINTCLDTSGSILDDKIKVLLKHTDRVLLDIKYTNDKDYKAYVGCSMDAPIEFLRYLDSINMPVTIRQVIIPTLNDTEENINALKDISNKFRCVDKIELLPFKKICKVKYDNMRISFPFEELPTPDKTTMDKLNIMLNA